VKEIEMRKKNPESRSFRHQPRQLLPEEIELVTAASCTSACLPPPSKSTAGPDNQSKNFG
jgi:hypothetical protein